MQYYAIQCNTMQYHAPLITADGAYHCPVGSIMAIFMISIIGSKEGHIDGEYFAGLSECGSEVQTWPLLASLQPA